MKKPIWLVFLLLLAFLLIIGTEFVKQLQTSPIEALSPAPTLSPSSSPTPALPSSPQVSADQLFSHIQKLSFTRYTPSERSRARNYITTQLRALGWKPQLEKFPEGINIIAERRGTDKQAGSILVAAHYDTVLNSPGADDNASGVAVVLEIARLFGSRLTPRTLQLAFFDREEAGLIGSKAYAKNPSLLNNLRGVIVMDMVGYACYIPGCQKYPPGLPITPPSDQGDFLAVVGDTEHLPLLAAFQNTPTDNLPQTLTVPIPLKGLLTPDTLRSDHAPFWYQGIGAVLVTDTANLRTPHYHQPSDRLATIERKFFTGSAQVVVNAAMSLLESKESTETLVPNTPS